MSKIQFRNIRMNTANKIRLSQINTIIEEYQADGYILTLRQLYYQLVSRDIIPNKQSEYSKLSTLLKEGRMGGVVDWDAIEDRLRKPDKPASFESPSDILNAAINQYALPRQQNQNNYVEVWVEKDALSGVLKRVTEKYHIPIMVNRGYSSVSAMYDSYVRFKDAYDEGKNIVVLYLGDFDPSGLDMIRDIQDRTCEFFIGQKDYYPQFYKLDEEKQLKYFRVHCSNKKKAGIKELKKAVDDYAIDFIKERFTVKPIALTMKQINLHKPPPNPAKVSDPRANDYIKKYGKTSWEVDALNPDTLNNLLENAIKSHINMNLFNSIVDKEQGDKDILLSLNQYL